MEDLQSFESIITEDDFLQQNLVSWEDPITVDLGNGLKFYSTKPPRSGALLGFILNVLQNYDIQNEDFIYNVEKESLLYHRITEALKFAYGQRSNLGDPFDEDITEIVQEIVKNLTSDNYAYDTFMKINDTFTVNNASYYGADFYTPEDHGTTHLSVLAPNGDAVAVTSTINRSFGCVKMSPKTGII